MGATQTSLLLVAIINLAAPSWSFSQITESSWGSAQEMWSYVQLFEILHIPPHVGNAPGMLLWSHEASEPEIGGEKV